MKKIKEFINSDKNNLMLIGLFFTLAFFLSTFTNKESDFFWHIKAGEYMFKNGPLVTDIFSWSTIGKHWMSHEWLFEIIIYLLKFIFGNIGYIIYTFFCMFLIYIFIYKSNKEKMHKNYLFTLLWLLFSCIFMAFIQIRPHMLSFLLVTITLYLIFDLLKNENSKKIYFIPLLTVLWSNLHGGSSNLGYIFCFFTFIVGLFNFKYDKIEANKLSKKQLKILFIIGFISIFCTALNIHGFRMTIYPYINMMDSTMLSIIKEWTPTSVSDLNHLPFFLTTLAIFIVLTISKKKIKFIDFAFFAVGLYLGLKAIRFWPYVYIISSFFIFDYIEELKTDFINNVFKIFEVMLILCSCLLLVSTVKKLNINYYGLNEDVIKIIKKEKPERLFNTYDIGGELLYYDIPVFIDGRADLYSENGILSRYISIDGALLDYRELLKYYDFDMFIVQKCEEINSHIKSTKEYEFIYEVSDVDYVIYKKK